MAERFAKLYQLPEYLYSESAPIIVVAGALLKDSVSGNVIAQLKYKSVSDAPIKALKIDVNAMDVTGQLLQGVTDYQYLDLNVHNGVEFGSNKAIVMPAAVTRSFSIGKITVVFSNGETWESSVDMQTLPQTTTLQNVLKNQELIKQYRLSASEDAMYVPIESMGLWMCTCGDWNGNSRCHKCKCNKDIVFTALEIEELSKKMETRLANEKAQREEQERLRELARQEEAERNRIAALKKAEKQEKQKQTIKKIAIITVPILMLILAVSLWIYPSYVVPRVAAKQINKAMAVFEDTTSCSEEELLDALSVVMTTGIQQRLRIADKSFDVYGEDYYRSLVEAESNLLHIPEIDIQNSIIKDAFSSYVDGLKLQKKVLDEYSKNTQSDYSNIGNENEWYQGLYSRAAAIIILQREGILKLSADEYASYCDDYIKSKLYDALVGNVTFSGYDSNHYSITATLVNDTLANFDRVEISSVWNGEEANASIENWSTGETWNAVFTISAETLESTSVDLSFEVYCDGIKLDSKR